MRGLLPDGCLPGRITAASADAINPIEHAKFGVFCLDCQGYVRGRMKDGMGLCKRGVWEAAG